MTAPFLAATHVTPQGEGRYLSRFDEPWFQGRGAFGGVVAGQVLRAMEHQVADPARPVRSFTVHFCAPAVQGEARLQVRVERAGKLVTHVTARVENAAGVVAVASATFGIPRSGPEYLEARPPEVPPAQDVAPVPEEVPMPDFCKFFEYRFCVGGVPYSGAPEARTGGWIRPKGEPLVLDAALCVGLLDAYPPSVLPRLEGVRPAASVDFTVHFFHALPRLGEAPGAMYLRTGVSRQASEGFAEDLQELWSAEGVLLAQCRQLVAVLG
ncbi:thioesterase family protein [Stigmatella sp. ncwal1]|uniref:Thioesterase family protein n=1 Tax=Stigmatella ashevillensis TaxID=2995309 RepID=A0ABT5DB08_9BACT|nr:thioesterase family protein [Stigmatella ashevillena]MDC0710832.1 thioesterase family protein [Stigmatella ashevillena]